MTRSTTFAEGLIQVVQNLCADHGIKRLDGRGGTPASLSLYRANGSTTVVVSPEGETGTWVLYGPTTLTQVEVFLQGLVQGVRAATLDSPFSQFHGLRNDYLAAVRREAAESTDATAAAEQAAYDALAEFASQHGLCYTCGRADDTDGRWTSCTSCDPIAAADLARAAASS